MLKELIKIANELDSRGLAKEADVIDSIISLAGIKLVPPDSEKESAAESLIQESKQPEVMCSELIEGRMVKVVDRTRWTKEIVQDVTNNALDEDWGANHFASGMCGRLKPILEAGLYGDYMNTNMYRAWNSIRGKDEIVIDFENGMYFVYPPGMEEPKSIIAAQAMNILGETPLKLENENLKFTITFSRVGIMPEFSA